MSEVGWESYVGLLGVVGGFGAWMVMSVLRQLPVQQPAELISVQLAGGSRVGLARQVSGMVPDSTVPLVLVIGGRVIGSMVPMVLVIGGRVMACCMLVFQLVQHLVLR